MMAAPAPTAIPEMLPHSSHDMARAKIAPYSTGQSIRKMERLRLNTASINRTMIISATIEVE